MSFGHDVRYGVRLLWKAPLFSLLFGVEPFDPTTFAAALALVITVAMVACVGPALHAIRANPAVTLRAD